MSEETRLPPLAHRSVPRTKHDKEVASWTADLNYGELEAPETLRLDPIPGAEISLNRMLRFHAPDTWRPPRVKDPKGADPQAMFSFMKGYSTSIAGGFGAMFGGAASSPQENSRKAQLDALQASLFNSMRVPRPPDSSPTHKDSPPAPRRASSKRPKAKAGGKQSSGGPAVADRVVISKFCPPLALKDYQLKLAMAKRAERHREAGIFHFCIACLFYTQQEWPHALSALKNSAGTFERIGYASGLVVVHNLLSLVHYFNEDFEAALQSSLQVLALDVTAPYVCAVAELNAAMCCLSLERFDQGTELGLASLTHAQECQSKQLESLASGNLALCYLKQQQWKDAKWYLEHCMECCSLAGDPGGSAVCLLLLGEVYMNLSDYKHACFYFENAVRVAKEAKYRDLAEVARVNLGVARSNCDYKKHVLALASTMGKQPTVNDLLVASDTHPALQPSTAAP